MGNCAKTQKRQSFDVHRGFWRGGWADFDDDEKEDRIFCSIVFRQSENKEEGDKL